jgi:hypothetical protein
MLGLDYADDDAEPTEVAGSLAARWADRAVGTIDGHDIFAAIDEARRRGIPGLRRYNDGISDARGRHLASALSKVFGWVAPAPEDRRKSRRRHVQAAATREARSRLDQRRTPPGLEVRRLARLSLRPADQVARALRRPAVPGQGDRARDLPNAGARIGIPFFYVASCRFQGRSLVISWL